MWTALSAGFSKEEKKYCASPNLKTLLIEVNDDFEEQRNTVKSVLEAADWHMKVKLHAEMLENSAVAATFNQIWEKK